MKHNLIRKAVIPVAGLGSRFLPVTKSVPKEMLPIVDKPLIQYAVEEAAASGLETVILVVGQGKRILVEYFQPNPRLERQLLLRGKESELESLRRLAETVEIRTVWQDSPRGLAHAIGCARSQVGDEPFVVILPDALIRSTTPCARQLMDCYEQHPGCVIATRQVEPFETERFGILDVIPTYDPCCGGRTLRVLSLAERPRPEFANSRYGVFGRYVLPAEIFACIDQITPGLNGELQLTDALVNCSEYLPIHAYCFDGVHYDAGDKFGYIQATVDYALNEPGLSHRLRRHLASQESALVATAQAL